MARSFLRTRAAIPEETAERALVFVARELQQVVGRHVDVPVDGLDDTGERIAELGVVWKRKALAQEVEVSGGAGIG